MSGIEERTGRRLRVDPLDVAGLAVIGLVAATTGHLLRPLELYDDAGISFRYAQRFADGEGLTWNDHERVMGYSNPLYTLVLAVARRLGLPMIGTARFLGLLAFVTAVLLVAVLAHRFAGRAAAVGAAAVLIVAEPFRAQVLSGMEVGWSVVFGLGAVLAATSRRQGLAGVLLGLALLTKLDAAVLLAVPLGLMWWAVHRSWPWRMAGAAAVVLAPWLLAATAWYGSPVPNSVVFKLGDETRPFSRLWVLRYLATDGNRTLLLAVPAAAGLPVWWRASDGGRKLAAGALAGWFLLQALALSFIDLGADYPWYLTVLYPPLAILGVAALVRGVSALARRSGLWDGRPLPPAVGVHLGLLAALLVATGAAVADRRPAAGFATITVAAGLALLLALVWRNAHPGRRAAAALLVVAVVGGAAGAGAVAGDGAQRFAHRDEPTADELWEVDRREAGRQVGLLAAPDEAIATCFGWVGYEAIDRVVSDVCGLNQEDAPEEQVAWVVDHGRPNDAGAAEPVAPGGFRAAANITGTCQRYPEWSWFTLWVREGSDADRRVPEIPQVPEECGPS